MLPEPLGIQILQEATGDVLLLRNIIAIFVEGEKMIFFSIIVEGPDEIKEIDGAKSRA